MVRIPLGAVELVKQHSLLTVLSAVSSTDTHDLPSTKSSHVLLLSNVVRVLNALWKTVFDSTTRKDIIASDPPDEHLPELEDETHAKRKMSSDTTIISPKRIKLDSKGSNSKNSDIENSDTEMVEESEKSKDLNVPLEKLLPPLFVHEYLNTLMLLLPAIIANSPPTTLAVYLELVSEVVHYVEKVTESSSKKQKIRLAALAPEVMKEQVSNIVSSLHHQYSLLVC